MRIFITIIMVSLFATNLQGQLNDYKYFIVPKQFEGFKRANQHQTSTLVKHLLLENGFKADYDDAIPAEMNNNRCLGLVVRLDDRSSMFSTKTVLKFEDCHGDIVYETMEGKSKEKEYKLGYTEAITKSFQSVRALNYTYQEKNKEDAVTLDFRNDVKSLENEVFENGSLGNNQRKTVQQEATLENQSFKSMEPTPSKYQKGKAATEAVVVQQATKESQRYEDSYPSESLINKATASTVPAEGTVLYAQQLDNGYQLVDSSPKIVLTLTNTSLSDVYTAKSNGQSGIVFKKDDKWFFEYAENGEQLQRELTIKF